MRIKESELILNPNGSIYHLNLRPKDIAHDIILVGDQDRVDKVTKHFDSIEFTTQKREFKTTTGKYKGKRLSVVSSGIGPDNIDIVINELDAIVNIDLNTRTVKKDLTKLNIVRFGTSGSLQKDIPIDNFVISTHGLDTNGMLHFYDLKDITHPEMEKAFVEHTNWSSNKSNPIFVSNCKELENKLSSEKTFKGITGTAGGFYGPQGRVLRLGIQDPKMNSKIDSFNFKGNRITNLEMETSAIYGLSKLLGHSACSINAIIANRATGEFSEKPKQLVEEMIEYALNRLVN